MKKANSSDAPSRASLRDIPEVDFTQYKPGRRNPFAKRMKAHGWELAHDGPTKASLKEMPEVDLSRVNVRNNPYAARIKAHGFELQVGRRRPATGSEVGPTVVKSVRLPPELWAQLEDRAHAEGLALHALVRTTLAALLEEKPSGSTHKVASRAGTRRATAPSRKRAQGAA